MLMAAHLCNLLLNSQSIANLGFFRIYSAILSGTFTTGYIIDCQKRRHRRLWLNRPTLADLGYIVLLWGSNILSRYDGRLFKSCDFSVISALTNTQATAYFWTIKIPLLPWKCIYKGVAKYHPLMMGAFSKSAAPRILLNYQTLADLTNIYRLLQSLRRRRLSVMQAVSNSQSSANFEALVYPLL